MSEQECADGYPQCGERADASCKNHCIPGTSDCEDTRDVARKNRKAGAPAPGQGREDEALWVLEEYVKQTLYQFSTIRRNGKVIDDACVEEALAALRSRQSPQAKVYRQECSTCFGVGIIHEGMSDEKKCPDCSGTGTEPAAPQPSPQGEDAAQRAWDFFNERLSRVLRGEPSLGFDEAFHAVELIYKRCALLASSDSELSQAREYLAGLKDPATVWINMLRGEIARPRALDHYEECQARLAELEADLASAREMREAIRQDEQLIDALIEILAKYCPPKGKDWLDYMEAKKIIADRRAALERKEEG